MVPRTFWLESLESAWARGSIVWLAGARGVGKTSLCQSIPDLEYFHCGLPSTRRRVEDPEEFLGKLKGKKIVLDEIHRLPNPFEILKIAADRFPSLKVIATGLTSLQSSSVSREPLGEKITQVWLTPMMSRDLVDFGNPDLAHRFLRGGLPSFFLKPKRPEDFQEWLDSFWAKDIQKAFRLESRNSFQKFMELLFRQSGELFEASRFAGHCEVSRPTITKYLSALEATRAVQVLRPFSTQRSVEIISIPKVYALDTGFFCYYRGWQQLRQDDFQVLWKYWVLNELVSHVQAPVIQYWRDKRGHEVDFVLIRREMGIMAITGRWRAQEFSPRDLRAFRYHYPGGLNWIVCEDVKKGYTHSFGKLKVEFMSLEEMSRRLSAAKPQAKEIKTYS
jgi:predicted AAA+ superfamily ATPase